jgi:hypothetical protein
VFVALVIQHTKGIFSYLACLPLLYYIPLSHKWQDFRRKIYLKKMFFFISSATDTFLTLRRIQRDVIKNVHKSSCTVVVRFKWNLTFFDRIFKNVEISNYTKYPSSGSRVILCGRTDGRTDSQINVTKLIVAFLNFANAPKNDTQRIDVWYRYRLNNEQQCIKAAGQFKILLHHVHTLLKG